MMFCRDCLIWQRRLEDNKCLQLETIPSLAHIGFTDSNSVSELYHNLGLEFRRLIRVMDEECPDDRCCLGVNNAR